MVLGDKLVLGFGSLWFCKFIFVVVDRSGEFFVVDGYVRLENVVILCFFDRRLIFGLKFWLLRL